MTETVADDDLSNMYFGAVNAPGYQFSFHQEVMDEGDALKRAFAQFMVVFMPASGLTETLDSLKDAFEFHRENELLALPNTPCKVVHGRVSEKRTRDDMLLGE